MGGWAADSGRRPAGSGGRGPAVLLAGRTAPARVRDRGGVTERHFRFAVRVKPGARRAVVGGRWDGAAGAALLVAVAAPAVEGKANEAVRRALAEAFGVRPRDVEIVSGERSRDKVVELDPAPAGAQSRLTALLGQAPPG